MNIRDLQYIAAVAQFEHFGRAAKACHVSQPTLSGQIKKLETQLGVQIFERSNRRVVATDIGLKIIDHAQYILNQVAQIKAIAQNAQDPMSAEFKLGAFPTLASYIFPDLVTYIKQTMPKLRLVLLEEKTAELYNKLRAGEIDAALLALPIDGDGLYHQVLFEDEFMLAVPAGHELSQHEYVSQDTLSQYPILLLEEGHCLRDQALDVCQFHNINQEQDVRATSLETLRQMVKAGTGITFMPHSAVHDNESDIHYIPFSSSNIPKRTIGLVWRKNSAKESVIKIIGDFWR